MGLKDETQPSVWKTLVVFHFAFAMTNIAKDFVCHQNYRYE